MTPTRWDLSNIYTGLDDPQLVEDINYIKTITAELTAIYETKLEPALSSDISDEALSQLLNQVVDTRNTVSLVGNKIGAFWVRHLVLTRSTKQPSSYTPKSKSRCCHSAI